jgi:hypothetical protein
MLLEKRCRRIAVAAAGVTVERPALLLETLPSTTPMDERYNGRDPWHVKPSNKQTV